MACRDTKTAEKTAAEISGETGGELVVMKLDLASLASIRAFVADLKTKESKIHILINNAGQLVCHSAFIFYGSLKFRKYPSVFCKH